MVIVWLMSTWPNNKKMLLVLTVQLCGVGGWCALPKSALFIYFFGANKSIILQQQLQQQQPVKIHPATELGVNLYHQVWLKLQSSSPLTGRKWKWPYTYLSLVAICQGYNDRLLWMWCPGRIKQWFHQTTEQLVNYLTKQTRGRESVLRWGYMFSPTWCRLVI